MERYQELVRVAQTYAIHLPENSKLVKGYVEKTLPEHWTPDRICTELSLMSFLYTHTDYASHSKEYCDNMYQYYRRSGISKPVVKDVVKKYVVPLAKLQTLSKLLRLDQDTFDSSL